MTLKCPHSPSALSCLKSAWVCLVHRAVHTARLDVYIIKQSNSIRDVPDASWVNPATSAVCPHWLLALPFLRLCIFLRAGCPSFGFLTPPLTSAVRVPSPLSLQTDKQNTHTHTCTTLVTKSLFSCYSKFAVPVPRCCSRYNVTC